VGRGFSHDKKKTPLTHFRLRAFLRKPSANNKHTRPRSHLNAVLFLFCSIQYPKI
jgi:hypothetical protein